jgi:hypothetical protein
MMLVQACFIAALLVAAADTSSEAQDDGQASLQAAWQPIFDRAAADYELFRDREHTQRLQLRASPVYKWTAPISTSGVFGAVYVWTHEGCAEDITCFWRAVYGDNIVLTHEIHSLSPVALCPGRTGNHEWRPTAGLQRQLVPSAPASAAKAPARLAQMRRLAEAFSLYTVTESGQRTELRLLNTPLYRYQSTDPEIVDGALFAFVCQVGTDPEVFLVLEALKTDEGPRWHYALARFSHLDTFAEYERKNVWKAVRGVNDTNYHNADNTYFLFGEPAPE